MRERGLGGMEEASQEGRLQGTEGLARPQGLRGTEEGRTWERGNNTAKWTRTTTPS
jgi:hypothetical protein